MFTKRQNFIITSSFTFTTLNFDTNLGPDAEVKAAEGLDHGLDPADVQHGRGAVLLPAAQTVVELQQVGETLRIVKQLLCKLETI